MQTQCFCHLSGSYETHCADCAGCKQPVRLEHTKFFHFTELFGIPKGLFTSGVYYDPKEHKALLDKERREKKAYDSSLSTGLGFPLEKKDI